MVDICGRSAGLAPPACAALRPDRTRPAAAVLHYGQEVFEGIKAYRHADGSLDPHRSAPTRTRAVCSAARDGWRCRSCPRRTSSSPLRELIAIDGAWVPSGADQTLYLRPFMFAKEAFLGVRPAHKVNYYVIASPAGAYFTGGVTPVSIWLSEDYARAPARAARVQQDGRQLCGEPPAAVGGVRGGLRPGGLPRRRPQRRGVGGMNIVFVYKDGTLVTPQSPSILEGITRDSVLQLAEDRGHRVEGRAVSIDEWRSGVASGDIVEVFACGTAAVITPIGMLKGRGFLDEQPTGSLALELRQELTDIQYGRIADRHKWLVRLDG